MKKANRFRDLKNMPEFNPSKWEGFLEAGCYPYALNLKVNQFFLVGDLIGKRCTSNTEDDVLVKTLKEELEVIFDYEVKEVETDIKPQKGEKKIYLQRHEHTGHYHFLREDSDGLWSHKYPGELPERKDSIGKIIEDPDAMIDAPFIGWCFLLRRKEPE